MSSDARFIWCDIDGCGKKWRLAVSREMDDGEDGLYFPMTDIVERLRKRIDPDDPDRRMLDRDRIEAAEQIERLRAMVAYLEAQRQKLRELMDE